MEEIKYNFICISLIVLTFSNLLRISSSSSTVNREENVAFFGVTSQSTQFDIQSNSSLAVDNDLTTCSRTLDEKGANWTVWLNRTVVISRIKIRTGGTFFGPNFELHIGIGNNFDDSILCNFGSVTSPRDEHVIGCFGGPMTGNFLMVKNTFGGGVKLCDLKVIVCNDGFFGIECVGRCHCDEDAVCRKEDGRCPGLCAAGWNGTSCQSECSKGRFGLNCQKTCHCHNGSSCHFQTGTCPGNRCSQNWFGQSCQTAMPQLLTPPTLYSAGFSDITVVWHSWSSYVDPDVVLSYRVEYKLIDYSGDHDWQEGALVPDTFEFNQKATISDLQHNSFYDFRVIPVLLTSNGTMVAGGASPKSSTSFRTKCTAPDTPNITSVHSWIDFNRRTPHAVISIAWTPLTNLQSNCENILYYEILYQKRASSTPWIKMGAHRTESGKNITNVLFDTEYLVRLVAHNNYPMESSSEVVRVVTQPAHYGLVNIQTSATGSTASVSCTNGTSNECNTIPFLNGTSYCDQTSTPGMTEPFCQMCSEMNIEILPSGVMTMILSVVVVVVAVVIFTITVLVTIVHHRKQNRNSNVMELRSRYQTMNTFALDEPIYSELQMYENSKRNMYENSDITMYENTQNSDVNMCENVAGYQNYNIRPCDDDLDYAQVI